MRRYRFGNVTSGTRFETYVIEGIGSPNEIAINGAAAHLAKPGDLIIIACFISLPESHVARFQPKLVFVDQNNQIARIGSEVPGPHTPTNPSHINS